MIGEGIFKKTSNKYEPISCVGPRSAIFSAIRLAKGLPISPATCWLTPQATWQDHYEVVVGRRGTLSTEEARRKAEYLKTHSVELLSYDRISDLVATRYGEAEVWLNGKN